MTATAERRDVAPHGRRALALELALLMFPAVAIAGLAAFSVGQSLIAPGGERAIREKLALRATAARPAANPELDRQMRLAREHMRFALSKVASPRPAVGDISAGPARQHSSMATRRDPVAGSAPGGVGKPQPLAGASLRQARRPAAHPANRPPQRKTRQAPAEAWLPAPLAWPVKTVTAMTRKAAATLAPVKDTVAGAVEKAGEAIDNLKRNVL